MRYADQNTRFVPGQDAPVVDVAETPGALELLFGAYADEVRQTLQRPFRVNSYEISVDHPSRGTSDLDKRIT